MKDKLKISFSDNFVKFSFFFSVIFVFLQAAFVAIFYRKFPPYLPFFNSLPWGEDRLARPFFLLLLLLIFILVFLLNNLLGAIFYKSYPLLSRILSLSSFLFIFLGFLGTLQILLLVF